MSRTPGLSTTTAATTTAPGYDGVTVQWFASMDEYYAHMGEDDSPHDVEDIPKFLDPDHLEFVLTEEPRVIIDGDGRLDALTGRPADPGPAGPPALSLLPAPLR